VELDELAAIVRAVGAVADRVHWGNSTGADFRAHRGRLSGGHNTCADSLATHFSGLPR
jgi:hypothetical protein